MNSTQLVAWLGACTGVASFSWNVYAKLTDGPKLSIFIQGNLKEFPPEPGNPSFLRIVVHNRGSAPTTITNVSFHSFQSRWKDIRRRRPIFSAVLNNVKGPRYPYLLVVGGEWSAQFQQQKMMEEQIDSKHGLWVSIHHSFSPKPAMARLLSLPKQK